MARGNVAGRVASMQCACELLQNCRTPFSYSKWPSGIPDSDKIRIMAAQSQPLTIAEALSQAKKAVRQGNNALAAQLFEAILQQQPKHPVARKGLRRLQRSAPGSVVPQAQIDALLTLFGSGQMDLVEKSCHKLLSTSAQSAIVINILGSALQAQGRYQEAVQEFDNAIRLQPNFAEAFNNRGNALKELAELNRNAANYESVIASYEDAIRAKPEYPEAHFNLGNALKDLGRIDEAIESYKNAIRLNPDFAEAHRSLSALKNYEDGDAQMSLMEDRLAKMPTDDPRRIELCFALAKACEDVGDDEQLFQFLEEGNRLRKNQLGYRRKDDQDLFANIRTAFETLIDTDFSKAREQASIRSIFIVGMMRSGTSVVEQILASHSAVHAAGELELMNVLATPLASLDAPPISKKLESVRLAYQNTLTALDVPEKVVTDKMPLNFRWIGAILSAFPEAKIIHLNRDPMATCWSIYKTYFPINGNGYAYDMDDLAEYYKLYAELMLFWRDQYSDRIYELDYESLTENQEQETRKLLAHCGLDWEEQCLDFHKTKRVVKTTSANQVRKKMYTGSSESWKKYANRLKPLLTGLGLNA
jgi:tetratricopeptide (TPR) repeat protein